MLKGCPTLVDPNHYSHIKQNEQLQLWLIFYLGHMAAFWIMFRFLLSFPAILLLGKEKCGNLENAFTSWQYHFIVFAKLGASNLTTKMI